MAIIYVDSNAAGTANGSSWANAYTTIQAGITAWSSGDVIWVAHDSTETYTANTSLTSGTATAFDPIPLYRVNSSTDIYAPSPLDGTDIEQIIVDSTTSYLNFNAYSNWHGFRFTAGDAIYAVSGEGSRFFDCDFEFGHNGASASPFATHNCEYAEFWNCRIFNTGGTLGFLSVQASTVVDYYGCIISITDVTTGGIVNFEDSSSSQESIATFHDCDFSACEDGAILYDSSDIHTSNSELSKCEFINCTLNDNYVLTDTNLTTLGTVVKITGSSTGAVTYINEIENYKGKMTTSIATYRTEGFASYLDTVNLSLELATKTYCRQDVTFASSKISGIVEEVGETTFTIELLENFTTALVGKDCWLELHYYDDATVTHHKVDISSKEFIKPTYSALASGIGLSEGTNPPVGARSVKIAVTATVNKVGFYYGILHIGTYELGKVVNIDPMMIIS